MGDNGLSIERRTMIARALRAQADAVETGADILFYVETPYEGFMPISSFDEAEREASRSLEGDRHAVATHGESWPDGVDATAFGVVVPLRRAGRVKPGFELRNTELLVDYQLVDPFTHADYDPLPGLYEKKVDDLDPLRAEIHGLKRDVERLFALVTDLVGTAAFAKASRNVSCSDG